MFILHQRVLFCQGKDFLEKYANFLKKGLAFSKQMCYYTLALEKSAYAPVAQLDRVTGYEPVGQGFESLPAYRAALLRKILIKIQDTNHKSRYGLILTFRYNEVRSF